MVRRLGCPRYKNSASLVNSSFHNSDTSICSICIKSPSNQFAVMTRSARICMTGAFANWPNPDWSKNF